MPRSHRALSVIAVVWWLAIIVSAVSALVRDAFLYIPLFAVPGFGTVGGILAVRRPTSPFGWLMMAMASSPLISVGLTLPDEFHNGLTMAALAGVLVLFPTGSPPSRRWLVPMILVVVSWLGVNQLGVLPLAGGFGLSVGALLSGISLTACAFAPIVRYRRATGIERAQLQWLGAAAGVTLIAAIVAVAGLATSFDLMVEFGALIALVAFGFGIPAAILTAVLRYGLYEIDRIVSRTVAYGILAAVLTIGYVGAVVGAGAAVQIWRPATGDLGIWLPIVAAALVSLAFHPLRQRAMGLADRLVYGRRRSPYEALAGVTGTSLEEILPQIARLATEATLASRAAVWLYNGVEIRPAAVFPEAGAFPEPMTLDAAEIPDALAGDRAFPLIGQGELLGALTVGTTPGETLARDDLRLLSDLASHAAVAMRAVLEAFPLPAGTVTFLMTDIEGSTGLWEEDPDAMAIAIRDHDNLVSEAVTGHGGLLIKWRGEGDSTFSVFVDPFGAVGAAIAIQESIRAHRWSTSRPISIRGAIHTGEAELRNRDYFGRSVNRCARLRSLAVGGQTLMSAATRELTRDGLRENVAVNDLGMRSLKDIVEPEHVYELELREVAHPVP